MFVFTADAGRNATEFCPADISPHTQQQSAPTVLTPVRSNSANPHKQRQSAPIIPNPPQENHLPQDIRFTPVASLLPNDVQKGRESAVLSAFSLR